MKVFTRSLIVLLLSLWGVMSVSAKTEKVHATFAAPSNTNTSWNAETKTFTWSTTYYNQLKNIGLPNGDLTKYKKLVVDCEIKSGEQFRILFYKGGSNLTLYAKDGVNEFILADTLKALYPSDYNEYLLACDEICLSGNNSAAPGEAVINDVYLETYDDEGEKVYATFAAPSNTNTSWDAETKTFTWSTTYYNQLKNIGLPNGDITKYKKLVVDCEIKSGEQFRILFYKGGSNLTLYAKDGVNEFILADTLKALYPSDYNEYLLACDEICLSGNNSAAPGEAVINAVYLETYPENESVEIPDIVYEADPGKPVGEFVDFTEAFPTLQPRIGLGTDGHPIVLGNGDVVVGQRTKDVIADLSAYSKLTMVTSPNLKLVLYMNHEVDAQQNAGDYSAENEGKYVFMDVQADENGIIEVDLTKFDKQDLNCICLPWDNSNKGTVWYLLLTQKAVTGPVDVTFDFLASGHAVSSASSTDGDITEAETLTEGGVTLTISTADEGKTANRYWSTQSGPQLRMYSGSMTITAPEGKVITKVVIDNGKWGAGNTFNGEAAATGEWEGSAATLVVGIAANTQMNSIVVTIDDEGGTTPTPVTYPIKLNAGENGSLSADVEEAAEGATVTLTAAPAEGYTVDEFSIIDADNNPVAFNVNEETLTATFTMPASQVTVSMTFKATEVPVTFADGKYYLQNIGSERYWGAGNDWGTRASLLKNPDYVTLISNGDGTYKIESQVSNGGTAYYFNGDYMDNGSPVSLTIKVAKELGVDGAGAPVYAYTIANGENYFGYDGSSTVLGKNLASDSENALWIIATEDQMFANLATATADEPVDATFLITDHTFGRNHRFLNAWTNEGNAALTGGNSNKHTAEKYHGVFNVYQKLANAPAGVYKFTAQGFYRQDGSDEENLPVFYANEETAAFPVKTGTENSMADACASFENGLYPADPVFVKVTEAGDLTVGAKLETNTTLWCIWDNFELFYYGTEADINEVKFADLIESVNELVATATELKDNENVAAATATALGNAIAGAEGLSDEDAYKAAIADLEKAISQAKKDIDNKAAIDGMYKLIESTNVVTPEALATYKGIADGYKEAWEAGTLTETVVNPLLITGWQHNTGIAANQYLLSAWTIGGEQCVDYAKALYINTWSVEGENDGSEFKVPFFEYWTGDDTSLGANTLTGTVTGLAAGKYYATGWIRVRAKNGYTAPAYGITMDVNGGDATNVAAGAQVGTSQFYLGEFTATGVVADDGVLKINLNVAEDNNISWLSFQNVKFAKFNEPTNLDFELSEAITDGICTYAKDMSKNSTVHFGAQPVEGWDVLNETDNVYEGSDRGPLDQKAGGVFAYGSDAWLGGTGFVAPATAPAESSSTKALGLISVWGGDNAILQYTQPVTLEAGNYEITVVLQNTAGTNALTQNLIGFIADNGTSYLAETKQYPVGEWYEEKVMFSLDNLTSGKLSLGIQYGSGSGAAPHIFIDNVSIKFISDEELAAAKLAEAKAQANAALDKLAPFGDGLFMYNEAEVSAAREAVTNATTVAEVEAVTMPTPNAPVDGVKYSFQQKASGLYLSTYVEKDGEGTVTASGVRLAEEPVYFTFEAAEGGYYLANGEEYVGFAGTNNWTMAATADTKMIIAPAAVLVEDVYYYTLNEAKGMIATDGTDVGAACYTDKSISKSGDKAYWTISADKAPSNEADELVAPEGWTQLVSNGNLAGDEVSSYVSKEAPSADIVGASIVAGAGKDGSRGIVVKSADEVDKEGAQDWDTQFWIVFSEALPEGSTIHVEFDYKADKAATAGTQAHGEAGAYQHWSALGDINFTTEWQHFSKDITVDAAMAKGDSGNGSGIGMKSIAFNLAVERTAVEYNFDNFGVWCQKPAPINDWTDLIVNGTMEEADASCFYVTEQGVGGPFVAEFTNGAGKDGSKAVVVRSADNPSQDWDTQFFVRLPYELPAGTKFKFSFDYKADVNGGADTQSHNEPGQYIHWACAGSPSFTTEWQTYTYEGTVPAECNGTEDTNGHFMKNFQTVAFNLAKNGVATNFIFDNVKFEVPADVAATLTPDPAVDPVPYPKKETITVDGIEIPVIAKVTVNHEMLQKVAYAGDTDKFDVDAIVANFDAGTTMADLTTYWVNPDGTTVTPAYGGGTIDGWRNAEGFADEWSASANGMCVKITDPASGIIDYLGAHDGNFVAGDSYLAKYAFVKGEEAVVLDINITFVETPSYKPEIVKTIEISHFELAEAAYSEMEAAPKFDVEEVCTALGISDISEAQAYIVNVTTGNFVANTTDGWRDANGDACSWGDATNGFCLKLNNPASGEFDYTGAHDANFQVGDTYVAQWGLVANEKAVLLKVTVTFQTEEVVGINGLALDLDKATIFDLQGRRVQNVQKGNLYIINGKKVLVK